MDTSNAPPKSYTNKRDAAALAGFIAILIANGLDIPGWLQLTLVPVAAACFAFAVLFEWKGLKAEREWRKTQPAALDPLKGAPPLPLGENIGTMVGIIAFFSLIYLWSPHKDTGITGNELWMLVLLPIAVAAFCYASWSKKKHIKAVEQWKLNQAGSTAPNK